MATDLIPTLRRAINIGPVAINSSVAAGGATLEVSDLGVPGSMSLDLGDLGPHRHTTRPRVGRLPVESELTISTVGPPPRHNSDRHSLSPGRHTISHLNAKRELSDITASSRDLSLSSPQKKSKPTDLEAHIPVDALYEDKLGTLVRESAQRLQASES